MKKHYTIILFILLFSFAFASDGDAIFTESSAQPDGNGVRISWVTKDESQLKHFVIQRSNDDKNFIELDRISLKGPGYNYEYYDQDILFKSSGILYYKIVAFKRDGTTIETTMTAIPNVSGIFKTWGAIKAMFR